MSYIPPTSISNYVTFRGLPTNKAAQLQGTSLRVFFELIRYNNIDPTTNALRFKNNKHPLTQKYISKTLNISTSQTCRAFKALSDIGIIDRYPNDTTYYINPEIVIVGKHQDLKAMPPFKRW